MEEIVLFQFRTVSVIIQLLQCKANTLVFVYNLSSTRLYFLLIFALGVFYGLLSPDPIRYWVRAEQTIKNKFMTLYLALTGNG